MTTRPQLPLVTHERHALADLLDECGPTAPTVLPGWDAEALLEHLLLREQHPHLLLATALPLGPLSTGAHSARDRLRALPWSARVERFRTGPQRFSPVRLVDRLMNTAEYAVHHEDLRRAQNTWTPRDLPAAYQEELWLAVKRMSRMLVRSEAEVILCGPQEGLRIPARGDSTGSVQVHGDPLEILLWCFGREQAEVRCPGAPEALDALSRGRRGV